MDPLKLEKWIRELIEKEELWRFYKSKYWAGNKDTKGLKNEVLEEQKYECQKCLKEGKLTRADTVHHVQFVRKHPRLALSKYYTYKGNKYRNLIAVCAACHNRLHPEKHKPKKETFINEERW